MRLVEFVAHDDEPVQLNADQVLYAVARREDLTRVVLGPGVILDVKGTLQDVSTAILYSGRQPNV